MRRCPAASTIEARKPTTSTLHPRCVAGCAAARPSAAARSRDRAPASVTSCASLPMPQIHRAPRSSASTEPRGTHSSSTSGKRKRGGITPTTVSARPLICTLRPTIDGSAPKLRRHRSSLSSTTRSNPRGAASSSRKPRPSRGATPSSGNRFDVTDEPCTRSGRSPPVSVKLRPDSPASASYTPDDR